MGIFQFIPNHAILPCCVDTSTTETLYPTTIDRQRGTTILKAELLHGQQHHRNFAPNNH